MNWCFKACKAQIRADPGEVKWMNFHPIPFSEPPSFFFFLIPQILIGSFTLLQNFTPHFKILNPRLIRYNPLRALNRKGDFERERLERLYF